MKPYDFLPIPTIKYYLNDDSRQYFENLTALVIKLTSRIHNYLKYLYNIQVNTIANYINCVHIIKCHCLRK